MNIPSISFKYIKANPLNAVLNVLILSLGIAIIAILLLLSHQLEDKLSKNSKGLDLVIGAKGSPLQLVLCNLFHIDYPTGNISLSEAKKLASGPMVKKAIPLALGDSYQGFRIAGTNHLFVDHYAAKIEKGKLWEHKMQVTIGSLVAQRINMSVGDTFLGTHGMGGATGDAHEGAEYEVVGIFEKTNSVLDNLIVTSVESVWAVHEHEEDHEHHEHEEAHNHNEVALVGLPKGEEDSEITSLLVKFKSPMAAITMPRIINEQTNMQAASPSFEIARLFSIMGVGAELLSGFAYLMVFIAVLSIFISLYHALKERRYDLAVMRSLGSSRITLFLLVISEGILISLFSALVGLCLAHGVLMLIGTYNTDAVKAGISGLIFLKEESYILAFSLLIGAFTALIPALQSYRTDITEVLAKG